MQYSLLLGKHPINDLTNYYKLTRSNGKDREQICNERICILWIHLGWVELEDFWSVRGKQKQNKNKNKKKKRKAESRKDRSQSSDLSFRRKPSPGNLQARSIETNRPNQIKDREESLTQKRNKSRKAEKRTEHRNETKNRKTEKRIEHKNKTKAERQKDKRRDLVLHIIPRENSSRIFYHLIVNTK